MKAYYFPHGDGEPNKESLYVPGEIVVNKIGENCSANWTPDDLETMKKFIADKKRKLEGQGLMRRVEVSEDLVAELKYQVIRREGRFANIAIMRLFQAARVYRGGE